MKTIETLPLDAVDVGMRVAEAVLDASGHVLVQAGAEISESLLLGLVRREIAEIRVEREIEESPADREAHLARQIAHLDRLFRKAGDGAETRALYRAVRDHRMEERS